MKCGIKADLYLPKECLDIIIDRKEEVEEYFNRFKDLGYDIYLGEYEKEEVCAINFYILNNTKTLVNEDYKQLKQFLKSITGKQPKQVMMVKVDKIR